MILILAAASSASGQFGAAAEGDHFGHAISIAAVDRVPLAN